MEEPVGPSPDPSDQRTTWKARLTFVRGAFVRSARAFASHGVGDRGAALAFYTVVSLGPLVVLSVPLLGRVVGSGAAERRIIQQAGLLAGPQAAEIARTVLSEANRPDTGGVETWISIGILTFAATAVFASMQGALNRIWGVEPATGTMRNLIRTRLAAFTMVLALGLLTLITVVAGAMVGWLGPVVRPLQDILPLVWMADIFASWLLLWWFVGMVFKLLPDARISWADVSIGALATSGLLVVSRFAMTAFVARNATASMYGAAGSIFLTLIWIYISAQIFFFGAEFTQVWSAAQGREIQPEAYARSVDDA